MFGAHMHAAMFQPPMRHMHPYGSAAWELPCGVQPRNLATSPARSPAASPRANASNKAHVGPLAQHFEDVETDESKGEIKDELKAEMKTEPDDWAPSQKGTKGPLVPIDDDALDEEDEALRLAMSKRAIARKRPAAASVAAKSKHVKVKGVDKKVGYVYAPKPAKPPCAPSGSDATRGHRLHIEALGYIPIGLR